MGTDNIDFDIQIVDLFTVPMIKMGMSPGFHRNKEERGAYGLAMAEAAGIDPISLNDENVDQAILRRLKAHLQITGLSGV